MKFLKNTVIPIIAGTCWISISEFVRNEYVLKSYWVDHYKNMGLIFPSEPINGAIWGIWSLCFAIGIFVISKKFNLLQTTFLSWFIGFVYMWLVIGNMDVLPYKILYTAVPLSILEAFLAAFIIIRLSGKNRENKNE